MLSPLANKTFRRLFTAQAIALGGTGLSTVALALLAYDLAGGDAGIVLGTALALKMVAYVGIAPIVGAYAHRLPRKSMLVTLDVLRAALVACIPFVSEVWQIYPLIFLLNACSAGFTPTFQATIPEVLPDEDQYTRALSLSRLAYDLENLLSPLLAAAALVVLSYDSLFAINAVTFLVSALCVLSVKLPRRLREERNESDWGHFAASLRIYWRTPRLRGLLALSFAAATAGAMVIVNTVIYVREVLAGTESDVALAFAAFGGGSMVVALALPRLLNRSQDRPWMILGGVLLACGLFMALIEPAFIGLVLIWVLLGAGSSAIQTPAGRLLKRSAYEADWPALFAIQFSLSHACWLAAYPLAGLLGSTFSLSLAFLVLGLLCLAGTAVALFTWPSDDHFDLEHVHEAVTHTHWHRHDDHHQHEHTGEVDSESHCHEHTHDNMRHKHRYVIDQHHTRWPR